MKTGILLVTTLAFASTIVWLAGCGNDNPASSGTLKSPGIVSVSPSDGAADVETSSAITVRFNSPMNTESVAANLHLAGGAEMHEWMQALADRYHQGSMGAHMMDMDEMMDWMHRIQMPGEYHWSDDHDVCQFTPAGGLMPDTDYMLFMGEGMMSSSGGPMHMEHNGYGGYMYHFHTAQ